VDRVAGGATDRRRDAPVATSHRPRNPRPRRLQAPRMRARHPMEALEPRDRDAGGGAAAPVRAPRP